VLKKGTEKRVREEGKDGRHIFNEKGSRKDIKGGEGPWIGPVNGKLHTKKGPGILSHSGEGKKIPLGSQRGKGPRERKNPPIHH